MKNRKAYLVCMLLMSGTVHAFTYNPSGNSEYAVLLPSNNARKLDVTPFCIKRIEYSIFSPMTSKWQSIEIKDGADAADCDDKIAYVNKYDANHKQQTNRVTFVFLFDRNSRECDRFTTNDYTPAHSKFFMCTNNGVQLNKELLDHALVDTKLKDIAVDAFNKQEEDNNKHWQDVKHQIALDNMRSTIGRMQDDEILTVRSNSQYEDINKELIDKKMQY